VVELDALTAEGAQPLVALDGSHRDRSVAIGLADDPDAQSQYPIGWTADAHLLVFGMAGCGTTTALLTVALALTARRSADDVHLYALDFGSGELAPLAGLPHAGAVVVASDRERQLRLLRLLRTELDRRRDSGRSGRDDPTIVVLVDGFGSLQAELDDRAGQSLWSDLQRVWSDGPDVGIVFVVTSERAGAIPAPLASTVRDRLVLRLADRGELGLLGLRSRAVPAQPPGRAVVAGTSQVIQLARPAPDLAGAVALIARRWPPPARPPTPVRNLPTDIALGLLGPAKVAERPWFVPVGIGGPELGPVGLVIYPGEHVLVAGPARSGKSTALRTIVHAVREADAAATVALVAGPRSPLPGDPLFDHVVAAAELGGLVERVEPGASPFLVVIDDAEAVDDSGALADLLVSDRAGLLVVAAGRNDVLRGTYGHWTRVLRRSKFGGAAPPRSRSRRGAGRRRAASMGAGGHDARPGLRGQRGRSRARADGEAARRRRTGPSILSPGPQGAGPVRPRPVPTGPGGAGSTRPYRPGRRAAPPPAAIRARGWPR